MCIQAFLFLIRPAYKGMQILPLPQAITYQGKGWVVIGKVDLDNQVKVADIIVTAGWSVSPHHHLTLVLHHQRECQRGGVSGRRQESSEGAEDGL